MGKLRKALRAFRLKIFKKLLSSISRWASGTQAGMLEEMRKESNRLMDTLINIQETNNKNIKDLTTHFQDLHEDNTKEFMKNNKEISNRYRNLNAAVEQQLITATALVKKIEEVLETCYTAASQLRGTIHERALTIQSIQRATAFLVSDADLLKHIDASLDNVRESKAKIVRQDIQRLTENRTSVAARLVS